MIDLEVLKSYFSRTGKGVLRMRRDRLFGVSYWPDGLPTASEHTAHTLGATADGIHFCIPDGLGGWQWVSVASLVEP